MAKLRVHNIESGPASSDVAFGISGDTIAVSSDFGVLVSFNIPSTAIGSVGDINAPKSKQYI